jgi:hypothetical protein
MASQAERYRRLAQECSEMAHAFPAGERRTSLLEMARVWQRLADEQDHAPDFREVPTPLPAAEPTRPIVQQQQQSQPKDDDNKD